MKLMLASIGFLLILSSCAMYTASNVKVNPKKEETGLLELDEYKDVRDGYCSYMLSLPFAIFNQRLTSMETFIPLGLEWFSSSKRFGDFEAHAYYLSEGFSFGSVYADLPTFNYNKPRLEYRFIYAYPIWRTTEMIEQYQMDIGTDGKMKYYGILPTAVDIELSLRGGYEQSMSSFVSGRLEEYLNEKQPDIVNLQYYSSDLCFLTFNNVVKVGAIFQRKIATRFSTYIDDKYYHAASYKSEGFYFDLSYLVNGSNSPVAVQYTYLNNAATNDYQTVTDKISASMLFKKRPIGFSFGYKKYTVGRSSGIPLRLRFEFGMQAGYFPNFLSSIYGNFGIGIGIGKRN